MTPIPPHSQGHPTRPGQVYRPGTVRKVDEPVRAAKWARLVLGPDGHLAFGAVSSGGAYGVEAVATCNTGNPHRAPDPGCHCGFYGVDPSQTAAYLTYESEVSLDVEFSGRIVVGEHGWRAERQRVLRAVLREPEFLCPTHGEPATGVDPRGPLEVFCPRCGRPEVDDCETHWSRQEVRTIGTRFSDRVPTLSIEDWIRSELITDWSFPYQRVLADPTEETF